MSYIIDGKINVYHINCPKCRMKNSIKVIHDCIPGQREKDYFPCWRCGHVIR